MGDAVTFLLSIFSKCWLFLYSCSFSFYGYSVNLAHIILAFVFIGLGFSLFWRGGSY